MHLKAPVTGLISGILMSVWSTGFAAAPPGGGQLAFDVVRNEAEIGRHVFTFSGDGGDFVVDVATDIAVRVPLIRAKVYSYEQQSREEWRGGDLVHVASQTDNDGKKSRIDEAVDHILPGSLWSAETVKAGRLVNTIDGSVMQVHVADLGPETIDADGGSIAARHYRISGDLARDVWYDARGYLARLTLTADDGSTVTYVRK